MADQAETDRIAHRIQARIRQRILEGLAKRELELDEVYTRAAKRIRRDLRATGFTDAQVERVVRRALEGAVEDVLPQIEEQMRQAAMGGDDAARQQFRAIFGRTPEEAAAASEAAGVPFVRASSRAKRLVGLRLRGSEES